MLAFPRNRVTETMMRYSPIAAGLALALLTVSSVGHGQRAEPAIDARSQALLEQGVAAQKAGQFDAATDAFESALVVDPQNRLAFLRLAEVAKARGLQGKSIRLYREALALQPADVAALAGQGEAMVAKGAVERARENLAKIKTLCTGACPQADELAAVIAKGPPAQVVAAQAIAPKPTVSEQAEP